ncbi:MAG: MFS transporter [Thermoleophilaceae bacterium]|nr:MFS transporter [Thermoleophilaceae bacterium]
MSTEPTERRGLALALLASTQFVLILDAAIVSVALPSIGRDLDFAGEDLSWVANAYTLMFGGFLLLGGRVADLLGRRRVFIAGLVLFSAASLIGGLAQSALWLVLARAVQGLGAAVISPAALSLVMTLFPEGAERNKALGVWGAVAGSGGAAGVILGGVLTEWLGWEAVLFVNVPIGIVAALLATRLLPEGREAAGTRSFDVAGAVSVTAGLVLLVYALVDANDAGWGSVQTVGLAAASLVLLAAFVEIERRARRPLMPLKIFANRALRGANIVGLAMTMAMFPMFFFLTFYTQQVLGYSPIEAGFAQLPIALSIIVSAGAASQVVTRLGYKTTMVVGLFGASIGLVWFGQISSDGSFLADVLGPSIVVGSGVAFAFVAATIAATTGVSGEQAGLASGLVNTSQQIGGALGLAILVALATARSDAVDAAQQVALTEGYQAGFLGGAALALLGAVLALLLLSSRESRGHAEAARQGESEQPQPAQVAA